jgi:exonuclease VII small subunit
MPHQIAVRSGVINPKYPAAPRQWVTYASDSPSPGGAVSTPNLSSGAQRDFSRRWGGDAESKFPRLDAAARALTIGALGKVLSQGIQDLDDDDQQPPPPPGGLPSPGGLPPFPGGSPPPQSGSGSPSPLPRHAGNLRRASQPLDRASQPLDRMVQPLDGMVQPLDRAVKPLDRAVKPLDRAVKPLDRAVKPLDRAVKPLDRAVKPLQRAVAPLERKTQQSEDDYIYRTVFGGDEADPGPELPRQSERPGSGLFVSPALQNQQSSINKRRRGAVMSPNALSNIRKTLAEFEGF